MTELPPSTLVPFAPPEKILAGGAEYRLGTVIGRGGEGIIYELPGHPDQVAKLYIKSSLPPEKGQKLTAMAAMKDQRLHNLTAWPLALAARPEGQALGLVMKRITAHKDIHLLFSPRSRKIEFPKADWRFLVRCAANCARAVAVVHQAGCVIGDLNQNGLLVSDKATITLIDCDSFQVPGTFNGQPHIFGCDVGTPTYTPPELQGQNLRGLIRTTNHDNFGLAVLIFQLLFMGRHPFAGRFGGAGEMGIEQAIAESRFAYGQNRAQWQMQPPPHALPLSALPPELAARFEAAFAKTSSQGGRPTAMAWVDHLSGLEQLLAQCRHSSLHYYFQGLSHCPWCEIEQSSGVYLFNLAGLTSSIGHFDLKEVWQKIAGIAPPGPPPALPSRAQHPLPIPSAEATAVGHRPTAQGLAVVLIALMVFGLCLVLSRYWLGWVLGGVVAWGALMVYRWNSPRLALYNAALKEAETAFHTLESLYLHECGEERFYHKMTELENLRQNWMDVPLQRRDLLKDIEQNREPLQKQRFLENISVERAVIAGIGPARKAMLMSFGVESAWDATLDKLTEVPGFGQVLSQKLLDWRRDVGLTFRFDPTLPPDAEEIAELDLRLKALRQPIEARLLAGVTDLLQIRNQILAERGLILPRLTLALRAMMQAESDLDAARGNAPADSGV